MTSDVFEGGDVGFYVDKDNGHLKVKWTLDPSYDRLLRLAISRSCGWFECFATPTRWV